MLATFLVQGLDKHGRVKQPESRVPRRAERAKRREKVGTESDVKSLDEEPTQPAISENDTAVTAVDELEEQLDEVKEEEKEEEEVKEEEEEEEDEENPPSNPEPSEEPSKLSPVYSRVRSLRFTGEILLDFSFSFKVLKFIISCLATLSPRLCRVPCVTFARKVSRELLDRVWRRICCDIQYTYVRISRSALENTETMFATESTKNSSNSRARRAFL